MWTDRQTDMSYGFSYSLLLFRLLEVVKGPQQLKTHMCACMYFSKELLGVQCVPPNSHVLGRASLSPRPVMQSLLELSVITNSVHVGFLVFRIFSWFGK